MANTFSKKIKIKWPSIKTVIDELIQRGAVHVNNELTTLRAINIVTQYKYSFYDSLIIASALECGCVLLYSEDLQHGQIIGGVLKIHNPFK